MRRSVRNRLAELLLRAFEDPPRGEAIQWLGLFCDLAGRGGLPEVPLTDLLGVGSRTFPGQEDGGRGVLARMIGAGGLFRVRRGDTGEEGQAGLPAQPGDPAWVIALEPLGQPDLTDICGRVRTYASLLTCLHEMNPGLYGLDPLGRVLAQAAACFNAGLFFEAHEHLEQMWRGQPRGQTRRFLQGLIQISVGFHHAQCGSFDGAVNQLGKGLDKASGVSGEILGLDGDAFVLAVATTRDAILAGGRGGMQPMSLTGIPRMPVLGASSSRQDRGPSNPIPEEKAMTAKSPIEKPDP